MTEPHCHQTQPTDAPATRTCPEHFDQDRFIALFISAFGLIGFVVLCRMIYVGIGFGLSWQQFDQGLLLIILFLSASYFTFVKFNRVLSSLFGAIALTILALILAYDTSWLVMHTGRHFPFRDAQLAAADHFIGFDWPVALRYFNRHAYFDHLWQAAYNSIIWQPGVVIVVLALTRQSHRPFQVVIAMTVALSITCTAAIFFPALGPYEFFNLTPNDHPDISLITAAKMTSSLQWLRADALTGSLPHFEVGQISFPSFHAATAALFIWALWRTPFVRWIGLILNMSMLIATPVHGSHYMVDVLAGVAITMASIPVSLWLLRLMDRRRQISVDKIESNVDVDVSPPFSDRPSVAAR